MVKILVFPFLTLILSIFLLPAFCDRPADWPDNTLPDLECKHSSLVDCEVNSIDGGFKFNNSNSTVLFAGVVANIRGGECQIYIKAQYVRFEGSHISGCDIIIEATASVKLDKSTLSVEGSRSVLPFSKVDRTIGCSYAGAGGYCGAGTAPDYTYGDYNTPYYDDTNAFGMGASDPSAYSDALGGGRIVIITQELVFLEGHLVADGYPKSCPDHHNYPRGGSGGYIYVSSNSTFIYDSQSTISANGGSGCGNDALGGSGGRITLFTDVAKPYQFNIKAKGGAGPSRKPCSWGAAGTIFYQNATSNTGFRVEINQEDSYKDPLTFPTPTYLRLPAGANLTNITGANGATITIKPLLEDQAGNWTYNVSGVKLLNGSRLTFAKSSSNIKTCNISLIADYHVDLSSSEISTDCNLTVKAAGQFNATKGSFVTSTVANTLISIYADLYIMNSSAILFYANSPLKIYKNTNDGNYETLKSAINDPYWTLNYGYRIALQTLSMASTGISIKANTILINSGLLQSSYIYLRSGNLTNSGSVIATSLTCNSTTLPDRPSVLNPINFGLDINKMLDAANIPRTDQAAVYSKIFSDYTIFVVVQNHLTNTGLLQGSRLGVFANHTHITKRGFVTAAGLGCPAEKGPGAGFAVGGTCASTGGAHASNGGIGLDTVTVANTKNCLQSITKAQKLYGDVKNPLHEGSGGGSYKKIAGGSGGGVIILGALRDLQVNGTVNANGIGPAKSTSETEENGAGAGSGGSIQLHMRYINGNGQITANGGSLSSGSFGGVGSGGRIRIRLLSWMDEGDLNQNEENLLPVANKGERNGANMTSLGLAELDQGGDGSLHGNPCPPGYYGIFCQPCNAKTYKADFSSGECQKCMVTERAELKNVTAGQQYMCDFTCKYEVWYQGSPLCLPNIFYYAAYNDQGYLKTIGVLYTLALIASSWKSLKCWGRKKKAKHDQPYLSVHQDQSKDSSQYFNNSHVQRISLLGDNTPESKWFINADTVNLREVEEIREKIDYLIKSINRATNWKKVPMFFLRVFVLLYPPLYFFLLKRFRMKIARRVSNFIKEINQELAEYCVLRGLSVYYITLVVDDEASSGYLDLFHDDGEHSLRNTLLPVSYTLSGNGKYNSPYFINKNDSMMEHLIKVWTPRNSGLSEKDRTHFQYDFEKFIRKVNKKIKYIDFYSPAATFKHHLRETVKEVNKYKEIFAKQYAIFLNLTCFEVPRLTVEEVDLTQPFLQSPIRVSVLEDIEHEEFIELTSRIQKLKNESEYDIKLYLIVQNGRDLNDIEQKKNEAMNTKDHFPKKKKKKSIRQNEYIDVNINDLKENFFNKLDQISFNVEYSLPRYIADASPTGKQQKNRSQNAQKDVYITSRKYFTTMHKLLDSLLSFKPKTKRAAELYVFMSILIIAQVSFIWIRAVAVFGLSQPSAVFYYLLPFPFAPIFGPLFGLLGLFKGDTRKTLYFGVFNACCVANQMLNLVILGTASDTLWSISWKEWVSFLICIITQERIRCLLSVQTKR